MTVDKVALIKKKKHKNAHTKKKEIKPKLTGPRTFTCRSSVELLTTSHECSWPMMGTQYTIGDTA